MAQHAAPNYRYVTFDDQAVLEAASFVLTKIPNAPLLPTLSDSLAGRMETINLLPMARAEIREIPSPTLLELLLTNKLDSLKEEQKTNQSPAERIIEGGFPEPMSRESLREGTFAVPSSYISTTLLIETLSTSFQ